MTEEWALPTRHVGRRVLVYDRIDSTSTRAQQLADLQMNFVAGVSHELRTPLTVIRGQLEVLAALQSPSAEEVRRVQRLVQAEIARITRLVDDLLLLANTEHTEFLRVESIDLASFVASNALIAP